jgi:hypothetical protein
MTPDSPENEPYLLLKWGTLKGWGNIPEANHELMRRLLQDAPMSCAEDHPSLERKAILCELIRSHVGDIQNDWDGKHYTQAEAVEYVMNYGGTGQVWIGGLIETP